MNDPLERSTGPSYDPDLDVAGSGQLMETTSSSSTVQPESSLAGGAQSAASAVVDTVQDTASAVVDSAQQAASTVADTVQSATDTVARQADKVADATADKVQTAADTLRQKGTQPDAPAMQRQAVQTTADVLDKTAEYLREGDIHLLLEDLRGAIRRNPGASLLIGLGLGYLLRGTFFPSTGSQGQSQGRMTPRPPQPRAVPVYGGDVTPDYGASYSTDVGTATTSSYDVGTTSDIAPLEADVVVDDSLADSMLYGTDTTTSGAGDLAAGSTDYGADVGMGGDVGLGGDATGTGEFATDAGMTSDLTLGGLDSDLDRDIASLPVDESGTESSTTTGDTLGTQGGIVPPDTLAAWDSSTRSDEPGDRQSGS